MGEMMRNMILLFLLIIGVVTEASAYYNDNMAGEVDAVWVYADTDAIYFRTSVPTLIPMRGITPCNAKEKTNKCHLTT